MALLLALAMQVASASAPPRAVAFDLRSYRPAPDPDAPPGCARRSVPASDPEEIVVCARRRIVDAYPYEAMARRFAIEPVVAEMDLGGGATGSAYVDSVQMPQGQVSKRIMLGVKMPF